MYFINIISKYILIDSKKKTLSNCIFQGEGGEHRFIILRFWKAEVKNMFYWVVIKVLAELPSFLRL